jgi:hypothetical protein
MADEKAAVAAQIDTIAKAMRYRMEPVRLYRPNAKQTGTALKLDLRCDPTYNPKGYVEDVAGGCFLELVRQTGTDGQGNATFGWPEALRAKLGLADVTALLGCVRATWAGWEVLPGAKEQTPKQRVLFHKTDAGSTIIDFTAVETGGAFLRISKSADQRVAHRLSWDDLIAVEVYLTEALRVLLTLGVR